MKSGVPVPDELLLLIKSRYPVVYVETVDEDYVTHQLVLAAGQLKLTMYEWSITRGLKRRLLKDPYPETEEPVRVLKTLLDFVADPTREGNSLFVLKDFEKHLNDAVALRLFKDLVNAVRNSATTIILLASEYTLPADIESCAAHLVAGYPSEHDLVETINETLGQFEQNNGKTPDVRLDGREEKRMVQAFRGLTQQQVRNVLNQCLLENPRVDAKLVTRVERLKKNIFDRDGLLEFCTSEGSAAIANFDHLKRWVADRKDSFYTTPGILPPPKGILLIGVQGCGKSLAAKVTAGELGLSLYRLDLVKFYSKYIGETEQNLRKALKTIDRLSPICLWIDEIEKNFAASSGDIDGGVSQRLLGTFLTWMQERTTRCLVVATANDVFSLPPELLRKGRFDEVFFVDLPDAGVRERLFALHIEKRGLIPARFAPSRLAELTDGFSGAEIEQAVIASLYRAGGRKEKLTMDHVEEEIRSTKPLSVLKREDIAFLREWARDRTIPA